MMEHIKVFKRHTRHMRALQQFQAINGSLHTLGQSDPLQIRTNIHDDILTDDTITSERTEPPTLLDVRLVGDSCRGSPLLVGCGFCGCHGCLRLVVCEVLYEAEFVAEWVLHDCPVNKRSMITT